MDRYLNHFPATKDELSKELGEMRTLVLLKNLTERDWVRKSPSGKYELTLVGEHALRRYLGVKQ